MTQSRSSRAGFTLLELLAVMGIMLILATIAVTSYRSLITGSGITASLAHLRQSLALARQQAIMQGKSTYVLFMQTTNESVYVTCMSEGTKTVDAGGSFVLDEYRLEGGNLTQGSLVYNLSKDKAIFGQSYSTAKSSSFNTEKSAYEIITDHSIWSVGDRYGWEISKRVQLPRGFIFVDNPPEVLCFKPDGRAVDVDGNEVFGSGRRIAIREEARGKEYAIIVNMSGAIEVQY